MTRQLDRAPGETVPQFAQRMSDLVRLIQGIVQSHAGLGRDTDEVIDELEFINEHFDDDGWQECWDLRSEIERVISRMMYVERLRRILHYAQERSR